MPEIKEELKQRLLPLIEEEDLELVELDLVGKPPHYILRIFVDKAGGVKVEECADLSRRLSDYLDTEDLIRGRYTLEVSSPGLERPLLSLDDFRRKIGERVKIDLKFPLDEKKEIKGEIVEVRENEVVLALEDKVETIPWDRIDKGRIII
ncbi:MAG: ribosome maturation factor RimP [candidate division Zixibacteria bacterium]|nr:ribosome maturation factor RimP [candidate division Zixibacteria bacterium]